MAVVGEVRVLGQVGQVVGTLDVAGVGLLDTGEQPEQRRLAGAVLADQAERHTGGDDEVHPVEHHPVAVRLGEVARHEGRHVAELRS